MPPALILMMSLVVSASGTELLIRDVRIAYPGQPVDLLIRDGRVWLSATPTGQNHRILEGHGRFALHAWADAHHHVDRRFWDAGVQNADCESYPTTLLRHGVAQVTDLNAPMDSHLEFARGFHQAGIRYTTAGPNLGAAGGWGSIGVGSTDEMVRAIDQAAGRGVDLIKVVYDDMGWLTRTPMPMLDRPTLIAAVDRARLHRLPAAVHLHTLSQLRDAVAAGVDAVVHSIVDQEIDQETLTTMREQQIVYVPTLSVYYTVDRYRESVERQASPGFDTSACGIGQAEDGNPYEAWWDGIDLLRAQRTIPAANVKRAWDAGVPIAVGTDSGTPGVFGGPSLRLELKLMVEAGIPMAAALDAATPSDDSPFSRRSGGRLIRDGDRAEILLFDADPHDPTGIDTLSCVVLGAEPVVGCAEGSVRSDRSIPSSSQ